MISNALQFTNDVLDQYLRTRFGLDESKVLLNTLIESNGSVPQANQNKVVISLINIERETSKAFNVWDQKLPGGNYANVTPFERYYLDLLISSNFDDYGETLRFLNAVILFFQVHQAIDAADFSNIPAGIHRLEFEVEKINYQQMQGLWTAMGARYQPSIIYKMRLVTLQGEETRAFIPGVSQVSSGVMA